MDCNTFCYSLSIYKGKDGGLGMKLTKDEIEFLEEISRENFQREFEQWIESMEFYLVKN